jgi:hypothetical protein
MKQTAVEWLENEMQKTYIFNQDDFEMFKKAKEMEKQQSDDYAIEFAGYYEEILASGDYNLIDKDKKQLLEIFKKEKGL